MGACAFVCNGVCALLSVYVWLLFLFFSFFNKIVRYSEVLEEQRERLLVVASLGSYLLEVQVDLLGSQLALVRG